MLRVIVRNEKGHSGLELRVGCLPFQGIHWEKISIGLWVRWNVSSRAAEQRNGSRLKELGQTEQVVRTETTF
jgi:hypothetical protein